MWQIFWSNDEYERDQLNQKYTAKHYELRQAEKEVPKKEKELADAEDALEECKRNSPQVTGDCGHTYYEYKSDEHRKVKYSCEEHERFYCHEPDTEAHKGIAFVCQTEDDGHDVACMSTETFTRGNGTTSLWTITVWPPFQ